MIQVCVDVEDPVLAMVMCGQRRIPSPVIAGRRDDEDHVHVTLRDEDEPAVRRWMNEENSRVLAYAVYKEMDEDENNPPV